MTYEGFYSGVERFLHDFLKKYDDEIPEGYLVIQCWSPHSLIIWLTNVEIFSTDLCGGLYSKTVSSQAFVNNVVDFRLTL